MNEITEEDVAAIMRAMFLLARANASDGQTGRFEWRHFACQYYPKSRRHAWFAGPLGGCSGNAFKGQLGAYLEEGA